MTITARHLFAFSTLLALLILPVSAGNEYCARPQNSEHCMLLHNICYTNDTFPCLVWLLRSSRCKQPTAEVCVGPPNVYCVEDSNPAACCNQQTGSCCEMRTGTCNTWETGSCGIEDFFGVTKTLYACETIVSNIVTPTGTKFFVVPCQ